MGMSGAIGGVVGILQLYLFLRAGRRTLRGAPRGLQGFTRSIVVAPATASEGATVLCGRLEAKLRPTLGSLHRSPSRLRVQPSRGQSRATSHFGMLDACHLLSQRHATLGLKAGRSSLLEGHDRVRLGNKLVCTVTEHISIE